MTPYSYTRDLEVIWTGAMETAAVKAQQRRPERDGRSALRLDEAPSPQRLREHIEAYLRRYPGTSAGGLSDGLGVHKLAVSNALVALERRGVLVRTIAPRGSRLKPTVWHVRAQRFEQQSVA